MTIAQANEKLDRVIEQSDVDCCPGCEVDVMNGKPILRRGRAYFTLDWRGDGINRRSAKRAFGFLCQRR